ncbi:hypothetical protein K493DRAFT_301597 [Basidiobolus meristosporus CBS 931.73]|uniref:Yeast cell wall synthesis Kre9/Knh1-like N-terminal domain-containing protein n=1 Tax=Basidiobolus meristosporus CBS 931.73 TaxID=1314790 RepID=A0A1Y1YBW8_9FUNG|nr:hypothetical protein K493DRAFT_301597 [Basidiobolus meristosporus CBS 931.73]|eukprot:ORX95236.1 hypothetical protein K493DRAFT_301597 [Basidiobolus meristosporus CBS 931.73]
MLLLTSWIWLVGLMLTHALVEIVITRPTNETLTASTLNLITWRVSGSTTSDEVRSLGETHFNLVRKDEDDKPHKILSIGGVTDLYSRQYKWFVPPDLDLDSKYAIQGVLDDHDGHTEVFSPYFSIRPLGSNATRPATTSANSISHATLLLPGAVVNAMAVACWLFA